MILLTNSTPLLVLGAGGHAKVLIDTLLQLNRRIIGVCDNDPQKIGMEVLGIPVIGDDNAVWEHSPSTVQLVNGIGSIRTTKPREQLFDRFTERGYQFATVVHPSAIVAKSIEIQDGAQIMAGAVIQVGCCIGGNSIINTKASIDHDCIIGRNVHIGPGATLSGGVVVSNNVHIGTGATIIQGVKIGESSIIAAGAVVIDDIPFESTVMGVPGKVVK